MVLKRKQVAGKFHSVTTQLEQALSELIYEELGLSDEVREQVELVHAQFKRAKGRADTPDLEIEKDLSTVLSQRSDRDVDQSVLRILAEKLQLGIGKTMFIRMHLYLLVNLFTTLACICIFL